MELKNHCKHIRNQSALDRIEEEINEAIENSLRYEDGEDVKTYFKDPEWIVLEDILYIIRRAQCT